MESKYYTPDISEFHVGFEYEVFDSKYEYKVEKLSETKLKVLSDPITTTGWFKEAYEIDSFLYVEDSSDIKSNIPSYIENDKVRVKYLDREDIESLVFIESKETEGYFYKELNSNSEKLVLELIQYEATGSFTPDADINSLKFFSRIKIHNTGGSPAYVLGEWVTSKGVLYYGECKNKSELKRILKMIGYGEN